MNNTTQKRIATRIIAEVNALFDEGSKAFNDAIARNINKLFAFHPCKDVLASKVETKALIDELAENGKVAIVHGGRDCDMAQWDNRVTILPASVAAVNGWWSEAYKWAEGPIWGHLERPSVAEGIESESRDLALEAFEDGHPHVCYA